MDLVSSKVITQIAGRAQPRGFLWKSLPRAAFASLIPTLHPGAGWVWLTFIKCQLLMGSLPFVAPLKTVWRLSGILCPCVSRDKLQCSHVYWRFYQQINHIHYTTTATSSIFIKEELQHFAIKTRSVQRRHFFRPFLFKSVEGALSICAVHTQRGSCEYGVMWSACLCVCVRALKHHVSHLSERAGPIFGERENDGWPESRLPCLG